jgi:hypothetical protein
MQPYPIQEKYFRYLQQICGACHYLELFQEQSERIDRSISICLAVTSSASIAGWAVWGNLGYVWPTLIALSQVVSVVKIHLPYGKRLEVLKDNIGQFKRMAHRTERDWYRVSSGALTADQINDLINNLQEEQLEIETKMFSKVSLPVNQKYINQSALATRAYLNSYYGQRNAN